MAVPDEAAGALDGGALLDVFEYLGVPGFKTHDEQPTSGFLHRLEGVKVGCDTGVAGPGEAEGFQLFAKLDSTGALDIKGIVVEKELLDLGKKFFGLLHLCRDVIGRSLAPCVARESLRPEAEGALRRTAACGVKRDEGVQKERYAVLGDVKV